MGKAQPTRRSQLAVKAVNPRDGSIWSVTISHARLQAAARRSSGQLKEAAYLVPMVLQSPSAVFRGLLREEDEPKAGEGWLCYCGVPQRAYRQDGSVTDPWPGEVFLVFVNGDRIAYNWYWTRCSREDASLPEEDDTRFKERLL